MIIDRSRPFAAAEQRPSLVHQLVSPNSSMLRQPQPRRGSRQVRGTHHGVGGCVAMRCSWRTPSWFTAHSWPIWPTRTASCPGSRTQRQHTFRLRCCAYTSIWDPTSCTAQLNVYADHPARVAKLVLLDLALSLQLWKLVFLDDVQLAPAPSSSQLAVQPLIDEGGICFIAPHIWNST